MLIFRFLKLFLFWIILIFNINFIFASVNVIDISFIENIHEKVNFNPLNTGSGNWYEFGEIQTYTPTGTLFIKNNHPTDAVYNTILNISGIKNIYNLTFSTGKNSIISYYNTTNNYMIITIPELPFGTNVTYTYNINESLIKPAINFTSSYSDPSMLVGLPITVIDKVSNGLNSSQLLDTCIYNISIIQNTSSILDSGGIYNFTINSTTLSGSDSTNVTISTNNRSMNWNLWNSKCFNSGNSTNISYDMLTPKQVPNGASYNMMNTTINYRTNNTVSLLNLNSLSSITNLKFNFDKFQSNILTGDNATWRINSNVSSKLNITVNLTKVTLWVSVKNVGGTGFTNPSVIDNDTISGAQLIKSYYPNVFLNSTMPYWANFPGSEWFFNYTYSSSPVVWMDLKNNIVNDGTQLSNSSISYGNNSVYIKNLYLTTGYWIEITKNITRISNNNYTVFIEVTNRGSSPTPGNQSIVVYNFLPNTFNLTSNFSFSSSSWYNTDNTSTLLNDPTYNGTMYQFAILNATNSFNASLGKWGPGKNINNTWNLTYNVSGSGTFKFEDLFLTGVDPLHVRQYGGTKSLNVANSYKMSSSNGEYVFMSIAGVLSLLWLLL